MDTKIAKKQEKRILKKQALEVKLSKNTNEMSKLKEFAKKTKNSVNIFVCYHNIFNCKRS